MSHDCSKVSGCIQSKTQYLNTEININNQRYLVGCSYWARSFSEVRSCKKWVEAWSKPLRRWKEVPNSQQNDAGLLIFWEDGDFLKGLWMLKNLKLLLKLMEETQGKCDGCVTQAEGQLLNKSHLLSFQRKSVLQRGEEGILGWGCWYHLSWEVWLIVTLGWQSLTGFLKHGHWGV